MLLNDVAYDTCIYANNLVWSHYKIIIDTVPDPIIILPDIRFVKKFD